MNFLREHKTKLAQVHQEFLGYCYVMQYEYDHFRPMDYHHEFDEDGNQYDVYTTNSDWY
jgi:ubiquinone biosynthesis protein Coq4